MELGNPFLEALVRKSILRMRPLTQRFQPLSSNHTEISPNFLSKNALSPRKSSPLSGTKSDAMVTIKVANECFFQRINVTMPDSLEENIRWQRTESRA